MDIGRFFKVNFNVKRFGAQRDLRGDNMSVSEHVHVQIFLDSIYNAEGYDDYNTVMMAIKI